MDSPVVWIAKYVNGTAIRSLDDDGGPIADDDIALRWFTCTDHEDFFAAGTCDDERKIDTIVNPTHIERNCKTSVFDHEAYQRLTLASPP